LRLFARDTLMGPCAKCGARDLSICGSLSGDDFHRFTELMHEVSFHAGATLFLEGEPAYHVFNVTAGTIKLVKLLPDGRRQITGFLSVGDFLGLGHDKSYSYSAEAVTDVRLCRFARERLDGLLDELPTLQHCLFERASKELAAAQDQMLLLGRKTAVERVASFLLAEAGRAERQGGAADEFQLPMARNDIADYLGLTSETVSRAFTKLKREGYISLPQGQLVRIQRRDALGELAGAR
jgi:CRP/FNR family transcriptional regulator